ncbi:MAG: DUF2853 family protein [Hyphomicrobiaceae bacterium]
MSDTDHLADVQRYLPDANADVVAAIVRHLGIALRSRDASLVSCSSKSELERVRESWCKKKLTCEHSDADLDAAIKKVCETMKGDHQKKRVTFYYLLARELGKTSAIA